ncbi:hypothetical protein [Radiobacillus sp. PE A8.2]|uniref:hypothetical protein n=1 Tax=Radiobacillus sp. PE A8.2 TaxID=3380349 RepID=UPI00388E550C
MYHEGLYDFPPVALYDMENDPYQQYNVAVELPEFVQMVNNRLIQWEQEYQSYPLRSF